MSSLKSAKIKLHKFLTSALQMSRISTAIIGSASSRKESTSKESEMISTKCGISTTAVCCRLGRHPKMGRSQCGRSGLLWLGLGEVSTQVCVHASLWTPPLYRGAWGRHLGGGLKPAQEANLITPNRVKQSRFARVGYGPCEGDEIGNAIKACTRGRRF